MVKEITNKKELHVNVKGKEAITLPVVIHTTDNCISTFTFRHIEDDVMVFSDVTHSGIPGIINFNEIETIAMEIGTKDIFEHIERDIKEYNGINPSIDFIHNLQREVTEAGIMISCTIERCGIEVPLTFFEEEDTLHIEHGDVSVDLIKQRALPYNIMVPSVGSLVNEFTVRKYELCTLLDTLLNKMNEDG